MVLRPVRLYMRITIATLFAGSVIGLCQCTPPETVPVTAGSSATSTGSSGSGGSGGEGGAFPVSSSTGKADECSADDDCPGPLHSPCGWPMCRSGVCGMHFVPAGPWPEEVTAGDCLSYRCDGAGEVVQTLNPNDMPTAPECMVPSCAPGPVLTPMSDGTKCSVGVCAAGNCVD